MYKIDKERSTCFGMMTPSDARWWRICMLNSIDWTNRSIMADAGSKRVRVSKRASTRRDGFAYIGFARGRSLIIAIHSADKFGRCIIYI